MNKIGRFFFVFITGVFLFCSCSDDDGESSQSSVSSNNEWVIMYYVDADNDLEEFLLCDLNEMESVDLSSRNIKVIALVDRVVGYSTVDGNWTDTRAFEIGYDASGYNYTLASSSKRIAIPELGITESGASTELNMGSGETVRKFASFVKQKYSASNYMLLFTNHGNGWREDPWAREDRFKRIVQNRALCWDETNGDDSLNISEVRVALEGAGFTGSSKLKIIAMDACLMGMVEVAKEMSSIAEIMVASEETIPGYGFPYTQIFTAIKNSSSSITPPVFAQTIVNEYYNAYTNGTNAEAPGEVMADITISAIDLSKIDAVVSAVNDLGKALKNGGYNDLDSRIATVSYGYPENVDLYDFCNNETAIASDERKAVKSAVSAAVIANKAGAERPGSYGLAIYYPPRKEVFDSDYSALNIQFAVSAPNWVSFLQNLTPNQSATDDDLEICYTTGYESFWGNNGPYQALANGYYGSDLKLDINESIQSYIYSPTDEDWYYIAHDTYISVSLTVPTGCDYDLYLLDMYSGETLDESFNGTGPVSYTHLR
ncbi:MAG: clostripain-related cysteine peptidase, partial [Spirochaetes bacterium]|nr:clostripain-related cysteine peptidase [Spirochaetota bacterium]